MKCTFCIKDEVEVEGIILITILWTELGGDRCEQCNEVEAEQLMKELQSNPAVKLDDVIIFFENSFGTSSYGNTYNLPIGTKIKIISEGMLASITEREITDIGIKYEVVTDQGIVTKIYDRNIEVL